MISEKKDRLLGSSGSSKTKTRGRKSSLFGFGKQSEQPGRAVTKKHVLKKKKRKKGNWIEGTYTLNAYRRAPPLACHTGEWCLCYCCTQTRCIGVDDTQQLWLLLSAPPCWQVWCLQYLGESALRNNLSSMTTTGESAASQSTGFSFFFLTNEEKKDTKTSVCDFQVP